MSASTDKKNIDHIVNILPHIRRDMFARCWCILLFIVCQGVFITSQEKFYSQLNRYYIMITKEDRIFITGGSGFIGTNLIDLFVKKSYNFINLDKAEPIKKDQINYWIKGNIVNMADLESVFSKYHPTVVIHLAARTDTLSTDIKDYLENTQGSKNIIDIVKNIHV